MNEWMNEWMYRWWRHSLVDWISDTPSQEYTNGTGGGVIVNQSGLVRSLRLASPFEYIIAGFHRITQTQTVASGHGCCMCNLICFAIWEANWQRSETRLAVENMAACEQICWNCTHDVPVISLLFAVWPSNASAMCAYASAMHMCMHVYASAVQMYVQMLCICAWLHMHVWECNAMQCNTRQLRTRGPTKLSPKFGKPRDRNWHR